MPQFTNDLTPELLATFTLPVFSEEELAGLDNQTRQQLLVYCLYVMDRQSRRYSELPR